MPADQDRLRGKDRYYCRHDAQELGRNLCPGARRGEQSQGRRVVGWHWRPASAGRRRGLDRRVHLADARRTARLGDQAGGGRRQQDDRGLFRCAGLRLQQGSSGQERPVGAQVLGRPDQAGVQGPDPDRQSELVGHRLYDAGDDGPTDGRGQWLRLHEGPAPEHQPVHQVGFGADQGRGPRRNDGRHRLHARRRRADGRRLPDRDGGAMRRHRLRDRLDVADQGARATPMQRRSSTTGRCRPKCRARPRT